MQLHSGFQACVLQHGGSLQDICGLASPCSSVSRSVGSYIQGQCGFCMAGSSTIARRARVAIGPGMVAHIQLYSVQSAVAVLRNAVFCICIRDKFDLFSLSPKHNCSGLEAELPSR